MEDPRPGREAAAPAGPPAGGTASVGDRLARLSRIARGLAHEIKNPLSTMSINLALLQEDWERAAALDARLSRLGALDDESLRYGLAYAHFETGDHDRAEDLLRGIEDARLFRQATSLREAIDKCRERPEQCG